VAVEQEEMLTVVEEEQVHIEQAQHQ